MFPRLTRFVVACERISAALTHLAASKCTTEMRTHRTAVYANGLNGYQLHHVNPWTPEQVQKLRENIRTHKYKQLAMLTGHPVSAVVTKCRMLGLKRSPKS